MIFPGIFLVLTTLAFNLLGRRMRDALDPRSERLGHGTVKHDLSAVLSDSGVCIKRGPRGPATKRRGNT